MGRPGGGGDRSPPNLSLLRKFLSLCMLPLVVLRLGFFLRMIARDFFSTTATRIASTAFVSVIRRTGPGCATRRLGS